MTHSATLNGVMSMHTSQNTVLALSVLLVEEGQGDFQQPWCMGFSKYIWALVCHMHAASKHIGPVLDSQLGIKQLVSCVNRHYRKLQCTWLTLVHLNALSPCQGALHFHHSPTLTTLSTTLLSECSMTRRQAWRCRAMHSRYADIVLISLRLKRQGDVGISGSSH